MRRSVAALLGWVLVALVAFLIVLAFQFNRMVVLRNRCKEAWANVDTELRRRHDLIPNLVAAVKGYMAHEQQVLLQVTEARQRALGAPSRLQLVHEENALAQAMGRLFALAEGYPQLKASRSFLQLQDELAVTEDRIQAARRFYNGNVRDYRDATKQFPGLLFAPLFGFRSIPFFEVESPQVRARPAVAFGHASA